VRVGKLKQGEFKKKSKVEPEENT